ncbi:MAG: CPBP family intramembrane metalloprotease [Bacilli bacterium]|nr:CPBP family intramembrane metalloprotease [Bacilli bacterium]
MKKIIKNIIVFLLYFVYVDIILFLLKLTGIKFKELDLLSRVIVLLFINSLFIVALFFLYKKELKKDYKDFKKNYKTYLKKYVYYYMIGVILMALSNVIIQQITNIKISGNEESIHELIKIVPFYMFFQSIIYAPFVEEIIFRKTIRNVISNDKLFIILSGVIFGVIHISDYSNFGQVLMGIPYIIMGIDFAYIYHKTGNIFTTMSFHFIHNLILYSMQLVGGLL